MLELYMKYQVHVANHTLKRKERAIEKRIKKHKRDVKY